MLKLKKEDDNYGRNMGVDDIEDIMAAGLDWTQKDFSFPEEPKRDYDDVSKLITIAQAERIIGQRPDATKPKPPTSKNPRPATIQKFKEDLATYKDRVKELTEWEGKYDRLVSLAQLLKNTKDRLDDLEEELAIWCSRNPGLFIVRKSMDRYSLIQDPVQLLLELEDKLNIPDEVTSLNMSTSWNFDEVSMDEDSDIFPTVLLTVGKNIIRIISVPEDLNDISDALESVIDTIQPKNILSMTNAKLDVKSERVLKDWDDYSVTNSLLDESDQEMKLYLASLCFEKEIQQLKRYPDSSKVSELVNILLKNI